MKIHFKVLGYSIGFYCEKKRSFEETKIFLRKTFGSTIKEIKKERFANEPLGPIVIFIEDPKKETNESVSAKE